MRIFITGDSERPIPPQHSNIEWIYLLVSTQIQAITGIKPIQLESDKILQLDEWIKTYCPPYPTWIEPHLKECAVIGFEMPDNMIHRMRELKIPFIDINVHPIRFLDDLAFLLKGCVFDFHSIENLRINNTQIQIHANLVRSQMKKLPTIQMPPNSALIIGQTNVDRSVLHNNRIWSLGDYRTKIQEIISRHPKVFFKPHPHNKELNIPGIEKIEENIYYLLSQDNLSAVYGISSSCLHEAKYFNKHTEFFGMDKTTGLFPIMSTELIQSEFWNILLSQITKTTNQDIKIPSIPSRIRRSCRSYWGFDFIEK